MVASKELERRQLMHVKATLIAQTWHHRGQAADVGAEMRIDNFKEQMQRLLLPGMGLACPSAQVENNMLVVFEHARRQNEAKALEDATPEACKKVADALRKAGNIYPVPVDSLVPHLTAFVMWRSCWKVFRENLVERGLRPALEYDAEALDDLALQYLTKICMEMVKARYSVFLPQQTQALGPNFRPLVHQKSLPELEADGEKRIQTPANGIIGAVPLHQQPQARAILNENRKCLATPTMTTIINRQPQSQTMGNENGKRPASPTMTQPAQKKRGRPLGSTNKKTFASNPQTANGKQVQHDEGMSMERPSQVPASTHLVTPPKSTSPKPTQPSPIQASQPPNSEAIVIEDDSKARAVRPSPPDTPGGPVVGPRPCATGPSPLRQSMVPQDGYFQQSGNSLPQNHPQTRNHTSSSMPYHPPQQQQFATYAPAMQQARAGSMQPSNSHNHVMGVPVGSNNSQNNGSSGHHLPVQYNNGSVPMQTNSQYQPDHSHAHIQSHHTQQPGPPMAPHNMNPQPPMQVMQSHSGQHPGPSMALQNMNSHPHAQNIQQPQYPATVQYGSAQAPVYHNNAVMHSGNIQSHGASNPHGGYMPQQNGHYGPPAGYHGPPY